MAKLILVIDDKYGRFEYAREDLELLGYPVFHEEECTQPDWDASNLVKAAAGAGEEFALVVISGQVITGNEVTNSHEQIESVVASVDSWALVLHDVQFESGKIDPDGYVRSPSSRGLVFGEESRDRLLRKYPALPVIMLTAEEQVNLRDGQAVGYMSKLSLSPIVLREKLARHGNLNSEEWAALMRLPDGIIVNSDSMKECFSTCLSLANSEITVLLRGEPGTGKEELARFIHFNSARANDPLRCINMATIQPELAESTLFGHVKGAFTGATSDLSLIHI